MKFQDDISNMKTHKHTHKHTHTDKPKQICPPLFQSWGHNESRTNGPINAPLTIAQVMPRYNHNNEKQEALL